MKTILSFITFLICVFGLYRRNLRNNCLAPGGDSHGLTRPARADILGRRVARRREGAAKVSADERADYKADFEDPNGHSDNLEEVFLKPILLFITCRICVLGGYLRNLCFTSLRE